MTVLFAVATLAALVSVGMWLEQQKELERAQRAAAEVAVLRRDLHEALRCAAAELDLPAPIGNVAEGSIEGARARLVIGERWIYEVAVALRPLGLPSGVSIGPLPRGRAQEAFGDGSAIRLDYPPFDRHFALYGSAECHGDDLAAAVALVNPQLVAFVVENFNPLIALHLSASGLSIEWQWGPAAEGLQPESMQFAMVTMWREAERLAKNGHARGVLTYL